MNLITYREAADMLDISEDTLRQALKPGRDVLTKVRDKGRAVFLIKEQVKLFVGINPHTGHKKRLSFEALSPAERQTWQNYADEASKGYIVSAPAIDEETIARIVREQLLQQELEEAERKAAEARAETDKRVAEARDRIARYRKENPFPYRALPVAV